MNVWKVEFPEGECRSARRQLYQIKHLSRIDKEGGKTRRQKSGQNRGTERSEPKQKQKGGTRTRASGEGGEAEEEEGGRRRRGRGGERA